jgi:hypothetical protein
VVKCDIQTRKGLTGLKLRQEKHQGSPQGVISGNELRVTSYEQDAVKREAIRYLEKGCKGNTPVRMWRVHYPPLAGDNEKSALRQA